MNRRSATCTTVCLVLLLTGCSRTTTITGPDSDALAEAHSVPIELVDMSDQALQEQVSFLGRYLLVDSYRVNIAKNAVKSDWGRQSLVDLVEYRSIGDSTTLGMVASQATTGDLLSSEGESVAFWSSIGIDVVNMMLATRQMSDVSGFFMPATFAGVDVESAEHATKLAVSFTESRIRTAANVAGYDIACDQQCEPDSRARIYKLTRVENRPEMYRPDTLYLFWGFFDLTPMPEKSEDYLLSNLLGFVPVYSSETGNTWTIFIGTKLTHNESKNSYVVDRYSRLVTTPLSRQIRRAIYSGPRFMFWGSSVAEIRSSAFYIDEKQPGLIYFDDQIYTFPNVTSKFFGKSEPFSVTHTVAEQNE